MEPSQFGQSVEPCTTTITEPGQGVYILRLYITGTTPRSTRAVRNITQICQQRLAGRYDLEVIDIYQQPARAQSDDIIAVPTLLKKQPLPVQKLLGDLSNAQQLATGLGLPPK